MDQADIQKKFSPYKLLLPIVIGLGVVVWMFSKEFDPEVFSRIEWGPNTAIGFILILLLVGLRILGYTWRLSILTDNELNWKRCLIIIILWSFASAISPSAVGGTALAIVILSLEGMSIGKSTAIAIATLLLDLIFFVVFAFIMYLLLGTDRFFGGEACGSGLGIQEKYGSISTVFFAVLIGMTIYLALIFYAVFFNSNALRGVLSFIFKIPFLKKFRTRAIKSVDDIDESGRHFKTKKPKYFLALLGTTMLSWTARFLLVNPVLFTFVNLDFLDHLTLYARNFVLWMIMIIPTTPGASGVSEVALGELICEFVPDPALSPVLILVWRSFDYFIYLILGIIIVPKWLSRVFRKKK